MRLNCSRKRNNMDKFANLQAFVAVVETGSFSKAAERLDVVTTIPDLADIVREIGGDRVRVKGRRIPAGIR